MSDSRRTVELLLEEVVAANPKNAGAYNYLAELCLEMGQPDKAGG